MSTPAHPALHASSLHTGLMFGRQMAHGPVAPRRLAAHAHRWLAAAGVLLMLAGAAGLLIPVWLGNNAQRSTIQPPAGNAPSAPAASAAPDSSSPAPSPVPAYIGGTPTRIVVPAANIDLPVANGFYNQNTGEWTLSDTSAHYATPTAEPNNQSGGTLIYGHNTPRIFAALHTIPAGSQATVYTANGHVLTYALRSSEIVKPNDVSIFEYQGAPRLTLQTCTGVWSEDRKFFYFELVRAE